MDRISIVCLLVILFGLPACVPAIVDSVVGSTAITEDAGTIDDAEVKETPSPKRLIYVLDSAFNIGDGQQLPQILAFDPDKLQVAYTIETGYSPDVALSADGRFLYIVDFHDAQAGFETTARLRLYDIHNSHFLLEEVPISDRLLYKWHPYAAYPFLLVSPDGNRLFVRQYGYPDQHQFRLTALDTTTFDVIYEGPQPDCNHMVLALAAAWLCAGNLDLTLVDPESGSHLDQLRPGDIIRKAHGLADPFFWQIAGWTWTPDGRSLWLLGYEVGSPTVRRNQAQTFDLVKLDFSTLGRMPLAETSFQVKPAVLRLEADQNWLHVLPNLVLAPDGSRLYLGLNGDSPGSLPLDQISVYNTNIWEKTAVLNLPHPTWHFALSPDGQQLYAVSPFANSLTIFDTETLRETAVIEGLGYSPAQIIVP
jgi:YVTN family beta-propeller protein